MNRIAEDRAERDPETARELQEATRQAVQGNLAGRMKDAGDNTVIGVWATSSRPTVRVLGAGSSTSVGDLVQVSRLGMPLVNEVVLPLALKDAFNSLKPENDYDVYTSDTPAGALLGKAVLEPELQTLLNRWETLFEQAHASSGTVPFGDSP